MHNEGDEIHVSETEVSGGSKEGVVRWILGIGLGLTILFLSLIWIVPAMMQGDVEEEGTVSGRIQSTDGGDDTDSIIEPDAYGETGNESTEDTTPLQTVEN